MIRFLAASLLAGCTCASTAEAPTPTPAPEPVAPAPEPEPIPDVGSTAPVLLEWTARLPSGSWTGRQLTADGVVRTALTDVTVSPPRARWVTLHTLDEEGRRLFDTAWRDPSLHALPNELVSARRDSRSSARWYVSDPDGDGPLTERRILVESPLSSRVPSLEALDAALLQSSPAPVQTVIHTSEARANGPIVLGCDALQGGPMRAIAVALARREPLSTTTSSTADTVLTIEVIRPSHVIELEAHRDGLVIQRSPGSPDTRSMAPPALLQATLAGARWDEIRDACR